MCEDQAALRLTDAKTLAQKRDIWPDVRRGLSLLQQSTERDDVGLVLSILRSANYSKNETNKKMEYCYMGISKYWKNDAAVTCLLGILSLYPLEVRQSSNERFRLKCPCRLSTSSIRRLKHGMVEEYQSIKKRHKWRRKSRSSVTQLRWQGTMANLCVLAPSLKWCVGWMNGTTRCPSIRPFFHRIFRYASKIATTPKESIGCSYAPAIRY